MPLRDALERVLSNWTQARAEQFAQHGLANFIRDEAKTIVGSSLNRPAGLDVKGSAGAGQWAAVPWIAVFDQTVTDTATQGYYVVYLFNARGNAVSLSLNQGTTATRAEFRDRTREALKDRAASMRMRLADFIADLPDREIDLGSTAQLPADYEAGHCLGRTYYADNLPTEEVLLRDLNRAVEAYRALTFRGGLVPSVEVSQDDDVPEIITELIEVRRYKMHRRIERNARAGKLAKQHHGFECQGCGLDFARKYGPIGNNYIEAHHLRPISSLDEGVEVTYNVETDFAVLCANCHRMIHRTDDPSNVIAFKALIRE